MYHGAEHKSINCIENGYELTVENVRMQKTWHKRCGTSFLLVVMFVSILFFMFIVVRNMWLRMVLRILLIPLIAGVSYEFIRYVGSHDNIISNILSKAGKWLQSLTTAEPDDDMIEVAIASVNAVFDWKSFVEEAAAAGEAAAIEEEAAAEEEIAAGEETAAEEEVASEEDVQEEPDESGIEILAIDDESEEDDEILNALDRYFEAPK